MLVARVLAGVANRVRAVGEHFPTGSEWYNPRVTSPARQIARAASIVMLAFIASRILGLVREMVIGARFGTSAEYDAYLAAFRLPDLLYTLIAGGALASAFIPTFTRYLIAGDRLGAWRLTSAVVNIITLKIGRAHV